MIWTSGLDDGCDYANQRCIEFTGKSEEVLMGNGWAEGIHPDDRQRSMDAYIRAFDSRQPFAVDYRLRRYDGEYRWVVDSGVPRFVHDGSFAGYIGSAIDISERKQAEEALATVSQRLIDAQDKERRRIARELHDDINQRLALLAIELEQLQNTPSEFHSRVQQLGKQLTDISNDVQSLSHELHSPKLDYLGTAAAIRGFCSELAKKHGVTIDFREESTPKHLPKEVALCLFRVAQEALHNALKHSAVRHFAVEVSSTAERVQLVVRDAGAAFDVEEAKSRSGLGLVSMQERLNMLRGQFSVESRPGEGTQIVASVPLIAEDEGSSAGWKGAKAHSAGFT